MLQFEFDWFTHNIPSFDRHLSHLKGTPCRILEIGSHEGRSTTWLLENVANHEHSSIDCVDAFLMPNFWSNIAAVDGLQMVNFHHCKSTDAITFIRPQTYDAVFIDGSHWTSNVISDAVVGFIACKVGGIIIFDDYLWDDPKYNSHGCPKPAIDFFLSAFDYRIELIEKTHLVVVRKILD